MIGRSFDVAVPLGTERVLSVSHDRTRQHETAIRLTRVQETLGRRELMERRRALAGT